MTDPQKPVITPFDHPVFKTPKTAGDLLVEALNTRNPQLLANAVGLRPNQVFTLQLNFAPLHFSFEDIQRAMVIAGLDVQRADDAQVKS